MNYTQYVTGAHRDKDKFMRTVELSTDPYAVMQETMLSLIRAHDIDFAVGSQLDTLGLWVGQSRYLKTPLDDVYFTWDKSTETGWDSGIWYDTYSPTEGITKLDDDSYRYLLKMIIAANHWRGNINDAYSIWENTFGTDNFILITDYQNMSIDIGFSGNLSSAVKQMLKSRLNPFKPESVRVRTYFTSNNDGPMFAWDFANSALNGWDIGYFSEEITPE